MGFPMFSPQADPVLPDHFSAAVAETATRDLKDMVGNGMALCQVGAVLALVLVSTSDVISRAALENFPSRMELSECPVPEVVLDALAVVRPPTQLGVQQRELVA